MVNMAKKNDYVLVHYTGTFDDGEVFDTSLDGEPLEFQVGAGMVIPGFENAVAGMKVNDEKKIRIESKDAYGDYDEELVYPVPLEEIRQNFEPEIGMMIAVQNDEGRQMPAVIKEIADGNVFIDMNHPLAGRDLNFVIKLIEINDAPKYGCLDDCHDGCCDSGGCSGCC